MPAQANPPTVHSKLARAYLLRNRPHLRPRSLLHESDHEEFEGKLAQIHSDLTKRQRSPWEGDVPSIYKPAGMNIERGSSAIPLIEQGRQQIQERGRQLKRALGHRRVKIIAPDLPRTIESAQILHETTHQPISEISPDWMTQRMGWMEGLPSDDIRKEKTRLRTSARDEVPPGMGPFSTQPGESTNQYLDRYLGKLRPLMRAFKKSPNQIVFLVNHYSGIKATSAALSQAKKEGKLGEGVLADHGIDQAEFLRHDGKPGDVHRLYLCSHGDWHLDTDFDLTKVKPGELPWGIYILRHGLTAWNEEAKPTDSKETSQNVPERPTGGLSVADQAKLRDNLKEIMKSPGFSRMPSQSRIKIQNARFQLEGAL